MFTITKLYLWVALAVAGIGMLLVVDYIQQPPETFVNILADNDRYQLALIQVVADIPIHVHPEGDHIHYNLEGYAVINIGGKEVEVGPGTMTVIPAGVPHGAKLKSKRLRYFHVNVYVPGSLTSMKGEEHGTTA